MPDDARIKAYQDAAEAMRRGDFDVSVPTGPSDQVGKLGEVINELAHALGRRCAEYESLSVLSRELHTGAGLEDVLERVYASFRRVIPYDRIGFALLEDGGRTLRAHWAKMEYGNHRLGKGYSAPMAGSSLQRVLQSRRPRILNDLRGYLAEHPDSAATRLMVEEGVLSSLTCPLLVENRAVGFLFFSSRFAKTYEDAHAATFLQVADTVSAVLEKSRLHGELLRLSALKNSLLGMAAHDLRGPLCDVVSYVDLLQSGAIADEDGRRAALADVAHIAESALTLVESLLDVTAIESGHVHLRARPTPVRAFLEKVRTVADLMGRRKAIGVSLETAPDLPAQFAMDPDRIEQALRNLVSNAIKFSKPGSRVLLTARRPAAGGLEFSVRDEGPGLAREARLKLFREFEPGSAKPTGGEKSTGLGLAIVRRIMEAHNGTVTVADGDSKGAVFLLTLPPVP